MSESLVLWERSAVTGAATRLVDAALAARGGVLFVIGEAGLGKTSVLDHACRLAADRGVLVGLGRGDAMEASLPFGLVSQALAGLGGRGVLEQALLGLSVGDDRGAQFYRVLRWLEGRGGSPVMLALDDLHWADPDSLALVFYLSRRMSTLPVALIATLRRWPAGPYALAVALAGEGWGTVERLTALTQGAAGLLLAARVGRRPAEETVRRCWAMSAGNPLLLEQLAAAVRHGEDVAHSAGLGQGVVSEELLLARFAGLPGAGMRCAQAASVLGTGFAPAVALEVAQLGESEADVALDSLTRSGLVRDGVGHKVEFVHPLFRQALYEDLGAPMRAHLHERAFRVLAGRGMDAEAAEHAVRANLVGNPHAMGVLERAGRSARQAGAADRAVQWFQAAVDLAGDRAEPSLLLELGEALSGGGSLGEAIAILERVLSEHDLAAAMRVQGLWKLARALHFAGAHDQAAGRFEEAIDLAEGHDRCLAVEVLLEFVFASWMTAGPAKSLRLATRARELGRSCDGATRASAEATWGYVAVLTGDPAGIDALAAPFERDGLADSPEAAKPWGALAGWGLTAIQIERFDDADRLLRAALNAAERRGVPQALALLGTAQAYSLMRRGRLHEGLEALGAVHDACDLVPMMEAWACAGHAYVLLYMGRLPESQAWCEKVEAIARRGAEWNALLFLHDVMGHRHLREGRLPHACDHYAQVERIIRATSVGEPCVPPWGRHAVAAYVGAGRLDDASRVIEWLEHHARPLPCRWPRIAVACGRASLAEHLGDHDGVEECFRAALALHDEVDLPVEKVETLLDYGSYLRRSGHRARARLLLHDAVELGQACGAGWLVDLARQELAVAGGRRRRRDESSNALTAQERRVAQFAAAGQTNPQIARELQLSVSTVETHIEHIYAKLGVHSRRELMLAASGGHQQDGLVLSDRG